MSLPKLFLHWGPGGNLDVERAWFKSELPIHWWNQPVYGSNEASAFNKLVQACKIQLKSLNNNNPVDLIAHSFGGQLALALIQAAPELVNNVTLLAASPWPPMGVKNLAIYLYEHGHEELQEHLKIIDNNFSPENYWKLVFKIASIPNFFNNYWAPESLKNKEKYDSIVSANNIQPLHFDTMVSVTNDYFQQQKHNSLIPFKNKVKLIVGEKDPLFHKSDIDLWKKIFPNIEVVVLNTGHFI